LLAKGVRKALAIIQKLADDNPTAPESALDPLR
jgi:hypothetical protein